MKHWALTVIGAVLLAGCSGGAPSADEDYDAAAIKQELDAARTNFEAAIASGDMAALGALITPETIMVQPGSADWKAMQALAGGMPFAPDARIDITPIELEVINGKWAYEFGASVITYPSPDTGEEIELRDTYLILLRNDGSGWRPFREVASASPPPGGWPQDAD